MKRLFLTALIPWLFAFATTGSAEVVRLHSKLKTSHQTETVQNVPATLPTLNVSEAALRVGTTRSRHHSTANSTLTDAPPLFLPATTTPEVATLNASGERKGRRFKNSGPVISTPNINLNPVPFSAVPEPASTSLVLIGLFGTGMFFLRRYQARQA